MNSLRHLILQDLRAMPFRSIVIIICVAVVIGSLFSTILLTEGLNQSLEMTERRLGADLVVVPAGSEIEVRHLLITGNPVSSIAVYKMVRSSTNKYFSPEVEVKIAQLPEVERTSPQIFIYGNPIKYCPWCVPFNTFIIGFDPKSDFTVGPWMKNRLKKPLAENECIVGCNLAKHVGEKVSFYGRDFTVKGILEKTGMGLDYTAFITLDAAYKLASETKEIELKPGQISAVLVKVKPGEHPVYRGMPKPRAVSIDIRQCLNDPDARKYDIICPAYITEYFIKGPIINTLTSLRVMSSIAWVVSIVMIGALFAMIVREHYREIGLLRALGATPHLIFRLIISEALLLTVMGGIVGIVVGLFSTSSFSLIVTGPGQPAFLWPTLTEILKAIGVCLSLSAVTGVAASLYPAVLGYRLEPYDMIRRGELR